MTVPTKKCSECRGRGMRLDECLHCDGYGEVDCKCDCGNRHSHACDRCDGSGESNGGPPCINCEGTGDVRAFVLGDVPCFICAGSGLILSGWCASECIACAGSGLISEAV